MNVLMIHGIGQEGISPSALLTKWTSSLHAASPNLLDSSATELAYYGTTLAKWSDARGENTIDMGGGQDIRLDNPSEMEFMSRVLGEVASEKGISELDIEANSHSADGLIPMDNFIARRLVGLARCIEALSPDKGRLLLRLVKQGHTYLSSAGAADAVDSIVRPHLQRSPQVVISHSLGTVIAFKLLREMEQNGNAVEIPLFITMGSPLAVEAFKSKLGLPRRKSALVKRWVNFYDPSDFVSLGKPLDEENFANGIVNDGKVRNSTANAHGIIGYLPHKGVINELREVLTPVSSS